MWGVKTVTQQNNQLTQTVVYGINGPVVTVKGRTGFRMLEMVYVGHLRLIGEVIRIERDFTTIQVYEETTSLKAGEPVVGTGSSLDVTLGPGLMGNIFDGIERPLRDVEKKYGAFIGRGVDLSSLDPDKKWKTTLTVKVGDTLAGGSIFATVPETPVITHKAMLSPLLSGKVEWTAPDGEYTVKDTILKLRDAAGTLHDITLAQRWPIRKSRPITGRLPSDTPLVTGQRVIDTLFPLAKGGAAAIPGGFGTGKTTTQHQLAKYCDADIIIYVGCGERGNEMTQVLSEFSELIDPKTGRPLLDRTILIANTSNMPVAAREASIYTGITLAEYYRDMGYDTAIMADSTSRWAEALREISGRLEEMPADEGFPAYLPSRLAEFYERAGRVTTLSGNVGSVSIIGAVSPQGSDFSEPVTQNTKRFIRCFWALDKNLAYARHFPAINWNDSYSEYVPDFAAWYRENADPDFLPLREEICAILMEENKLMEIVKLIGADVLPDDQKLVIEVAHVLRAGFLQQEYFSENDAFVPMKKQCAMMKVILHYYHKMRDAVALQIPMSELLKLGLSEKLIAMKHDVPKDDLSLIDRYAAEIDAKIGARIAERGDRA